MFPFDVSSCSCDIVALNPCLGGCQFVIAVWVNLVFNVGYNIRWSNDETWTFPVKKFIYGTICDAKHIHFFLWLWVWFFRLRWLMVVVVMIIVTDYGGLAQISINWRHRLPQSIWETSMYRNVPQPSGVRVPLLYQDHDWIFMKQLQYFECNLCQRFCHVAHTGVPHTTCSCLSSRRRLLLTHVACWVAAFNERMSSLSSRWWFAPRTSEYGRLILRTNQLHVCLVGMHQIDKLIPLF